MNTQSQKKPDRLIAYIDGFNLYFGMRTRGWQRYYWLDVRRLVQNLPKPNQRIVCLKYFTARVYGNLGKMRRQTAYLEALHTISGLETFYGKYQLDQRRCRHCGRTDHVPNEKMTDVNIAVELLTDAFQDRFDTALLVSADSDLTGPVAAVRRLFPDKRVIAGFPPKRASKDLRKAATSSFTIGRGNIDSAVETPLRAVLPPLAILPSPLFLAIWGFCE